MRRFSEKELQGYADLGFAQDITYLDFSETEKFLNDHDILRVGYSAGSYGVSGALLQDRKTGEHFVILSRTNTLLQVM